MKFTISLRLETRRYERISDEDWWHLKFISIRLSIDYRLHCVVRFDWMNLSEKIESIIELQTSLLNKCRIVHYDWLEIHWTSSTTNNRCFFSYNGSSIFPCEHFYSRTLCCWFPAKVTTIRNLTHSTIACGWNTNCKLFELNSHGILNLKLWEKIENL